MVVLLSLPKKVGGRTLKSQASDLSTWSTSSLESMGLGLESPTGYANRASVKNVDLGRRRLSFSCSKFSMDKAAQGGHLDVLQLLHDQVGVRERDGTYLFFNRARLRLTRRVVELID